MLLNTNTPTLEMGEMKTQRELFIVTDETTNIPTALQEKIEQQKDSCNKISQLVACLTTALNEFELYNHRAISPYTKKEEIQMLKNKTEKLKEENINKLKHDMSEKDILLKF